MKTNLISLKADQFYYFEGFSRDKTGPVPFDGTEGQNCIVTGEAMIYTIDNKQNVSAQGHAAKVAVKKACTAPDDMIPDGIYASKTFNDIIYLEKYFN